MNSQVTIFVEQIDVVKWKLFQQYYKPFTVIVDSGVFQVTNGSVALNFDQDGVLQTIHRADVLYSKKHT